MAGDVVLYRRIPKDEEENFKFQMTINRTTTWLREHNLEVNPQKSHYIIFKNR